MIQIADCIICFICICEESVNANTNLALGKPAYQIDDYYDSGLGFSGTADRAVDGSTNGLYSSGSCMHTDSHIDPWWKVDLQDIYNIHQVVVFNRIDCCMDKLKLVELLISYDDTTYSLEGYYPGSVGESNTFQLGATIFGRWVQISLDYEHRMAFCEVQVFGERSPARYDFEAGQVGTGSVIGSSAARSVIDCIAQCMITAGCYSVNYHPADGSCDKLDAITYTVVPTSSNIQFYTFPPR